ncbi:MAG TPA: Rieske 2Fe-2S domain-containing protein [Steroidobacteraceae bacterium]|jgi:ubiquinol-cytochrome c reductase iron-sulfur subunit|nr:Rieske 2Fe-2S domain-containing protein [Steroidobacteraceae bacterium]
MNRRQVIIAGGLGLSRTVRAVRADEDVRIARFEEPLDVADIPVGGWCLLLIDGAAIYIRRRTQVEISAVRNESISTLPDPARDEERVIDPEWLVVSGECTHAACRVVAGQGSYQGWECFCHGSQFDLSGRVRHGPAKRNLAVIAYEKIGPQTLLLHAPLRTALRPSQSQTAAAAVPRPLGGRT